MLRRTICSLFVCFVSVVSFAHAASSQFVDEATMKSHLMQMLARFTEYVKADYHDIDSVYGCFRGENTMGSDERGVRTNADLGMVCAFLCRYGATEAQLPHGVTWQDLRSMARKSLTFSVATHKAVRRRKCADGRYWGSMSKTDHSWESSLWAMSVAYSAMFQWDRLDETSRNDIYSLLKAECNYELERDIPTGYKGDTKAEENGWEVDVLAVTLALFPHDALAPQWTHRMKEFATNCYSHPSDTSSLYRGQNLYEDYTLQNHDFFHTSYQNVVIQELGEAALALKMSAAMSPILKTFNPSTILHNCDKVTTNVLDWLSLPDGEQVMPNGNDWSLFLYDQITSYSTMACMMRNADALMLENQAYRQIMARQRTTADGSWLLRPDVGARRMGVQAHRVMMTWLMHEYFSTADMRPSSWTDFLARHKEARVFKTQNVVRAASEARFTCFSWSKGKRSFTGYIAPFNLANNNLIVPFRQNNTGNFIGWYTVDGCKTNAVPVVSGDYQLHGNAFVMNGELNTNDSALNNRFVICSTPGNAVIYLDYVRANRDCKITHERGGLMAISTDEFTRKLRHFSTPNISTLIDGNNLSYRKHPCIDYTDTTLVKFNTPWINIDSTFSVVSTVSRQMAFGNRTNNNSVMTSKLYASYSDTPRMLTGGHSVDGRQLVYYSNVSAEQTATLSRQLIQLRDVPEGWSAVIAADPDGTRYLLCSNFCSPDTACTMTIPSIKEYGYPVFSLPVTIRKGIASATLTSIPNRSVFSTIHYYINGDNLRAEVQGDTLRLHNLSSHPQKVIVTQITQDGISKKKYRVVSELNINYNE